MPSYPYPPSPVISDASMLNPSPEFRNQAYKMVRNIILFILLYFLLIIVGIGLLFLSGYLGVAIISVHVGFFTLAAGFGLFALGIMFFLFLIKFIFSRSKEEDPMRIQIYEKDHPKLFSFIRQLAKEVKTDFPKKIFLSPDVNAAVFYNSSFWSMFFPVRKNLTIRLGLVNSLNVSEFKAVVAHEFGHFSQRSMKVGSYVYTANKVIFNLVNERDSWDSTLEAWANTGGVFGFFASITFFLVNQVRSILVYAYNQLSKSYMSLSREMEYHADLVACSVASTDQMVSTLRKIEFTDSAYNFALSKLNELIGQKKRTVNLYEMHNLSIQRLATTLKVPLKDGFPVLSNEKPEQHEAHSRINIKDQWASHPSLEEREESVYRNPVKAEWMENSAWELFDNAEKTSQQMTEHLYSLSQTPFREFAVVNTDEFSNNLKESLDKVRMPEVFKNFYDNRAVTEFDFNSEAGKPIERSFDEIFSDETQKFLKKHHMNQVDLNSLRAIASSPRKKDFFEFDNKKVQFRDAPQLAQQVDDEIEEGKKRIQLLDVQAYRYFYGEAAKAGKQDELLHLYKELFDIQKKWEASGVIAEQWHNFLLSIDSRQIITEGDLTFLSENARSIEVTFKRFLVDLPFSSIESELHEFIYGKLYIDSKTRFYFAIGSLEQKMITDFSSAVFQVNEVLNTRMFEARKKLAGFKESLIS